MTLKTFIIVLLITLLLFFLLWLCRRKSRVKPELIAKIKIYQQGIDIFAKLYFSKINIISLNINSPGMQMITVDSKTIVIGKNIKRYNGYSDVIIAVEPRVIAPKSYELKQYNEKDTWHLYQTNPQNNLVVIEFNSRLINYGESLN